MEHHGDPDALYDWPRDKRRRAMTYLLAKAAREGRVELRAPEDEDAHIARLFGPVG